MVFIIFHLKSCRKYLGRIYTDSLVHDKDALQYLVKVIGEGHVMLGTDYPFPLGELDCGKLIQDMETFDNTLKVNFILRISTFWNVTYCFREYYSIHTFCCSYIVLEEAAVGQLFQIPRNRQQILRRVIMKYSFSYFFLFLNKVL